MRASTVRDAFRGFLFPCSLSTRNNLKIGRGRLYANISFSVFAAGWCTSLRVRGGGRSCVLGVRSVRVTRSRGIRFPPTGSVSSEGQPLFVCYYPDSPRFLCACSLLHGRYHAFIQGSWLRAASLAGDQTHHSINGVLAVKCRVPGADM